jgi:hypothetical protein
MVCKSRFCSCYVQVKLPDEVTRVKNQSHTSIRIAGISTPFVISMFVLSVEN